MKKISKSQNYASKLLLMLAFIAIASASQAVSVFVSPVVYYCTQTAANKIRFDVYVKNQGTDQLGYRSQTLRFTINRDMLPAGKLKGGTVTYVPGTGDRRLSTLQTTYNSASSFIISSSLLQVNLGGGGTVFDQNTAPRMNPGESIWLGTFEVTSPVNWIAGVSANPVWLNRGTSISVYDAPPSTAIATVCSGNPDDVDTEFPSAFSSRNLAVKDGIAYRLTATKTKAFTSRPCGDNSLRTGDVSGTSLNVFPNPTSGKLNISFMAADKEKYILCVVDLLGNKVITEEYTAQKGFNQHEIDLSSIAKGMYALTLEREGMEMQKVQIVVE